MRLAEAWNALYNIDGPGGESDMLPQSGLNLSSYCRLQQTCCWCHYWVGFEAKASSGCGRNMKMHCFHRTRTCTTWNEVRRSTPAWSLCFLSRQWFDEWQDEAWVAETLRLSNQCQCECYNFCKLWGCQRSLTTKCTALDLNLFARMPCLQQPHGGVR